MTLIKTMQDELIYEKSCLIAAANHAANNSGSGLVYSVSKDGYGQFFKTSRGSDKRKYISKTNTAELRSIALGRYSKVKAQVLSKNIKAIEKFLKDYRCFDHEALITYLPASYQKAIELVSHNVPAPELTQSENPKHREQLTAEVSNGLMVRSKSEMGIAEGLLHYGPHFQYEKALVLTKIHDNRDGTAWSENVTVYPDFTIFLPGGDIIYWEHCGLFDQEPYHTNNHEKFDLYYSNNIYPPKNLIITMDGPNKPFSNIEIRRIIQGLILSRY